MRHDDGPRPPSVATAGHAVVRAAPDAAVLSLEVWAEQDTPQAALDEVARRTSVLQEVLDRARVDASARSTSGVSITEQWDYRRDEQVLRGYRAATIVTVRVADLSVLGTVISESTRDAEARPHGPEWVIDPDNPARVEACRLAAEDARRKADAYASALGMSLGRVRHVREPGVRPGPPPPGPAMFRMAAQSAESAPDIPVESGDVEVRASVHVVFELIGDGAGG